MSSYHCFLIEYFQADAWKPAFHLKEIGLIKYWSARVDDTYRYCLIDGPKFGHPCYRDLFYSAHALFSMKKGHPRDMCAEYQQHGLITNIKGSQYEGWIGLDELMLPLWPSEKVFVSGQVTASNAHLFGDGRKDDVQELITHLKIRKTGLMTDAIDWKNTLRHNLYQLNPERFVSVSWRESLAQLFKYTLWEQQLDLLADIENPQHYRLITGIC